ncbi:hypothetical protein CVT26_011872 [Gymnopilus dilepis]|uniref:Uncharacterized protein n=1 Tax=Gymnopilus dilepis TaxID=231916 RepID=A0A409W5J5_9AGAR|nr:hypothetical protein CVT26_011872 [Gymnopilus dilepis]
MDRQEAIGLFEGRLKKWPLEVARRQLTEILASYPSKSDASILPTLQRLRNAIVNAIPGRPGLDILTDLGIAAASKGHVEWAKQEVMPFVESLGTEQMIEAFKQKLSVFAEASKPVSASQETVFEDASEDYVAAAPLDLAQKPSIEQIIQQSLPAMLAEPASADESIFEDSTDLTYSQPLTKVASLADSHQDNLSPAYLRHVLHKQEVDKAYTLLKEMKELGYKIPLDSYFAITAKKIAFRQSAFTPEAANQLVDWLSLVPEQDGRTAYELRAIGGHLADLTGAGLSLLARVCVLYASKGYVLETDPMMNILCHGLRDERLLDFVREYEAAYVVYYKRKARSSKHPDVVIAFTRNFVIRLLGGTGRHDEIEHYLPWNGEFTLNPSTYAHILLYPISEETRNRITDLLSKLKGEHNRGDTLKKIIVQSMEGFKDFRTDLVGGMKYLKECVDTQSKIPHPHTVSHFMDAYLATGRVHGLSTVFRRALKGNRTIARTFLLGEMLFYRNRSHPTLVIETFVDHFLTMGVPEQLLLRRYNLILSRREEYNPAKDETPPLSRFLDLDRETIRGRKMIPLTLHCNLVWEALIFTSPPDAIDGLYQLFLRAAQERDPQRKSKSTRSQGADQDTLDPPMAQPSSFMPFIRRLADLKGPEIGLQIIQDILNLRLQPHLPVYTEVAGRFAKSGKVEETYKIVQQLESRQHIEHVLPNGNKTRVRPPAPDFVFYVALLRGFVLSRKLEAAEEIVRRIQAKHKPRRGQNNLYDEALDELNHLKAMPFFSWYQEPECRVSTGLFIALQENVWILRA